MNGCYKDMTFCKWHLQCADGEKCPRAMSEEILEAAMAAQIPIATYISPPIDCYRAKEEATDGEQETTK